MSYSDTIIALATPAGIGAIAVIRISGTDAIKLVASKFESITHKDLRRQKTHTIHLGHIVDNGTVLDKVLVSLFRAPNSYTGEDVVEISCHGSSYIQEQIIQLFLRNGCRMANAGEFTLRAFLHGKMDLSQAEAVADLIASDSQAAHELAIGQMRGGFSHKIEQLRTELLNFASLIELELDFSEEDVEFADRGKFDELLGEITETLKNLIDSFAYGNAIKKGIPVAIVGAPNVGKSTLLNALLNEERAIVSDIAGTTRDTIEDQISIKGINFRFIDTAGIRETDDKVERIGIDKTFEKINQAKLVIFLFEGGRINPTEIEVLKDKHKDKRFLLVFNKMDQNNPLAIKGLEALLENIHLISAKQGTGIDELKELLFQMANTGKLGKNDTVVTNNRHYDALIKALGEVQKVKNGLKTETSSDLLAIDVRQALFHLGEITGNVTNEDLLGNIFANFCIGK
ncbi:MAG: tRNA uridine-5-carboxymethylaminomethyl(34) synthesis GTPase MnmE [Bacteroidota bacterium]